MPTPRDPDAHHAAAGLPTGTARTWDTPGGPMVQPEFDPELDQRVAAHLDAARTAGLADVLTRAGRRVSDLLAHEAQQRRDRIESSIAISEYAQAAHPDRHDRRPHAELERVRSTFDGVLDERHLALRADPDRGRARRRRAA